MYQIGQTVNFIYGELVRGTGIIIAKKIVYSVSRQRYHLKVETVIDNKHVGFIDAHISVPENYISKIP